MAERTRIEAGYTVGRDEDDEEITDESHAPGGGYYYLDSRTGEIAQHPAAPDPGVFYRIVASDADATATFNAGEYPLVVNPKVMKLPRDERQEEIEDLRRQQYEDPGWLFEQNPQFEPGAKNRPVSPPTSQAPMYPQDRHGSLADALRPQGPQGGTDAASPAPAPIESPAVAPQALGEGRRSSLADFLPAAQPRAVAQATQPQLQRLPDAMAKRVQAILGKRPGLAPAPAEQPVAVV